MTSIYLTMAIAFTAQATSIRRLLRMGEFSYSDPAALGPALPAGTYSAVISAGCNKNNTTLYATLPVALTITP